MGRERSREKSSAALPRARSGRGAPCAGWPRRRWSRRWCCCISPTGWRRSSSTIISRGTKAIAFPSPCCTRWRLSSSRNWRRSAWRSQANGWSWAGRNPAGTPVGRYVFPLVAGGPAFGIAAAVSPVRHAVDGSGICAQWGRASAGTFSLIRSACARPTCCASKRGEPGTAVISRTCAWRPAPSLSGRCGWAGNPWWNPTVLENDTVVGAGARLSGLSALAADRRFRTEKPGKARRPAGWTAWWKNCRRGRSLVAACAWRRRCSSPWPGWRWRCCSSCLSFRASY